MLDVSVFVHVLSRRHHVQMKALLRIIIWDSKCYCLTLLAHCTNIFYEYLQYFFLEKKAGHFDEMIKAFFFFLIGGWKTLKDAVS